jgi:hypothetical protein
MTLVTYVPGALIGYAILGRLDGLDVGTSPSVTSVTDAVFGWAVDVTEAVFPDWMLFPVGLAVLLAGFSVFDRVLPDVGGEPGDGRTEAWHDRKWPMFFVGCGVCLLTLSVSVALTVLVPLVAKGYVRRANTLPYIAGANITTLVDTLVAAILLGNQDGVRVVVAVTFGVTAWTLFVLTCCYPAVRGGCLAVARWALRSKYHLAGFAAALLAIPVALILI